MFVWQVPCLKPSFDCRFASSSSESCIYSNLLKVLLQSPPPSGMVSPWSFTTALQAVHLCRLFRSFQLFSRLTSFYLIKIALYPEVKCVILHFSSIYLFHRFIFSNSRQSFSQTSTLFIWQIIFVPANDKLLLRDESTHFLCFSILHSCFLFFSS